MRAPDAPAPFPPQFYCDVGAVDAACPNIEVVSGSTSATVPQYTFVGERHLPGGLCACDHIHTPALAQPRWACLPALSSLTTLPPPGPAEQFLGFESSTQYAWGEVGWALLAVAVVALIGAVAMKLGSG